MFEAKPGLGRGSSAPRASRAQRALGPRVLLSRSAHRERVTGGAGAQPSRKLEGFANRRGHVLKLEQGNNQARRLLYKQASKSTPPSMGHVPRTVTLE